MVTREMETTLIFIRFHDMTPAKGGRTPEYSARDIPQRFRDIQQKTEPDQPFP